MKPKPQESVQQEDLFRMRLEKLIDLRHELVRLASLIDWPVFEREFGAIHAVLFGAGHKLRLLLNRLRGFLRLLYDWIISELHRPSEMIAAV